MSVVEMVALVVVAVLAVAWYLTYTAARLDRLHTRVEGTFAALDAQLVRRAEAVLEVANSGLVDPAGALILAGAASESLEGGEADLADREAIESDLTRAIRLIVPAPADRYPAFDGVTTQEPTAAGLAPGARLGPNVVLGVGPEEARVDEAVGPGADIGLDHRLDPSLGAGRGTGFDASLHLSVAEATLARLDSAGHRVEIARRFHNDAVTDVLRLRDNPLVRVFRLAGYTALPRTVEFDDDGSLAH